MIYKLNMKTAGHVAFFWIVSFELMLTRCSNQAESVSSHLILQ